MNVYASLLATFCMVGPAFGQTASAPAAKPYDLNLYPTLSSQSGLYDLNAAPAQKGPPGTIAVTAPQAPSYSFQDVLANTHGYVSAGVSSRNGHNFEAGVSIPIVPGKAELELAASTGQADTYKFSGVPGKTPALTYDTYSAGLALHPTDDITAFIGVTGLRLHQSGLGGYPFGSSGIGAFPGP